ncbi:MAG: hypothetical protein J7M08_09205 [Planctomycetes bacterium]|nr:hypothetical protein [Planctomycetota bacterium]
MDQQTAVREQNHLSDTLTARVKKLARDWRMDLVGIADPERYHSAPRMLRPEALLPGARAVVVIAIRYPYAMFDRAGKEPASSMMALGQHQNETIGYMLNRAALKISRLLEDEGHEAVAIPVSGSWRVHPYKDIPSAWCANFSHRHAAAAAGLGELGLHSLLISPEFGVRQRFDTIITDAPLAPDPMYSGPPLCDMCMACVEACPLGAIDPDNLESCTIGDRTFKYAKVDHWRCAWSEQVNLVAQEGPEYFGQEFTEMPPEDAEVNDENLLAALHRKWESAGIEAGSHVMGACMRVCVPPHLRGWRAYPKEHLLAAPYVQ